MQTHQILDSRDNLLLNAIITVLGMNMHPHTLHACLFLSVRRCMISSPPPLPTQTTGKLNHMSVPTMQKKTTWTVAKSRCSRHQSRTCYTAQRRCWAHVLLRLLKDGSFTNMPIWETAVSGFQISAGHVNTMRFFSRDETFFPFPSMHVCETSIFSRTENMGSGVLLY